MSDKRYTAQEMREVINTSWHDIDREMVHAMLRQAADMVERCEKLRFNMIPHKHDTEIVDYILHGDAEEGSNNGK